MSTTSPSLSWLHIVPVGTSQLSNAGWQPGQKLPSKRQLIDRLQKGDPRKASAEFNGLSYFIDAGQCTHVHLLVTNTPEAQLCADALAHYLQRRHIHVTKAPISGLLPQPSSGGDQESFRRGIRQFREKIFRAMNKAQTRKQNVLLNATGGLKAEVAVAALVAAELHIPAYYQFERMPQPVFLPTSISDNRLRDILHNAIADPHTYRMAKNWDQHHLLILEFEGMIRIQRRADGSPSSVKLTPYGRYWAQRSSAFLPRRS